MQRKVHFLSIWALATEIMTIRAQGNSYRKSLYEANRFFSFSLEYIPCSWVQWTILPGINLTINCDSYFVCMRVYDQRNWLEPLPTDSVLAEYSKCRGANPNVEKQASKQKKLPSSRNLCSSEFKYPTVLVFFFFIWSVKCCGTILASEMSINLLLWEI